MEKQVKDFEYYMSLPYTITIIPDAHSECFIAKVNELPGCLTQAETSEETLRMIEDAKRAWIDIALQDGIPVPEPAAYQGEYSGKFNVRVPKSLHRVLVEKAEEEDVSLNQYILFQLARSIGMPLDRHG